MVVHRTSSPWDPEGNSQADIEDQHMEKAMTKLTTAQRAALEYLADQPDGSIRMNFTDEQMGKALLSMRGKQVSLRAGCAGFLVASITKRGRATLKEER